MKNKSYNKTCGPSWTIKAEESTVAVTVSTEGTGTTSTVAIVGTIIPTIKIMIVNAIDNTASRKSPPQLLINQDQMLPVPKHRCSATMARRTPLRDAEFLGR